MAHHKELSAIAENVRARICTLNVCSLFGSELERIWGGGQDLVASEKQMHVENFATHFGFKVLVNDNATVAAFTRTNTGRAGKKPANLTARIMSIEC